MPWIFFLLALGCMALAMRTQSMGLALLLLLGALGFLLAGALGLVSARIQSRTQGGVALNPALERERLRQQRQGGAGVAAAATPTTGSSGKRVEDRTDADDAGAGDGDGGD
jgi:hypothetical protein